MFNLVHKNKRIIQVFLALIALTFVTWGIESYTTMRGGRDTVATVNGMEISAREFDEELRRRQDQLRQVLGRQYDPAQFETAEMRRGLLDSLISQRLVASAAAQANLTVTDESLLDAIHSIPAFRGPEGGFSKSTYESVLRQQNPPMSPAQFESRLRYELALGQLTRAVGESAIPSRTVAQRLAAIEAQQREISEHRILAEQFLPKVQIDDAQVKAFYEANQAQFQVPERVKAEYVVLSGEAMAAQEVVKKEEVRQRWESDYGPRLREKEEARKKAQEIAAALKKDPQSFAELAKKESQDPGSREAGGDLGFAPRGSFVKPFEDVLFRMKEGQISEVVETEFGFHIIQLTGIQKKDGKEERRSSHILIPAPADAKPLEALQDQIEADLKKSRAERRYAEAAEQFQNMVYEQPDSLKPVAERFKLKLEKSDWISRGASGQELGVLGNPKLVTALFSADALRNKRNTDAVEVAPGTLVAARVAEHQPAAQRKFEEVKGEIEQLLRRQEAAALARKEGTAKLELLRKGENAGVKWSPPKTVSRLETQNLPEQVLRPVMSAEVSKLPSYVGLPVADAGYMLIRISKVIDAEPAQAGDRQQRTAGLMGSAQYQAYIESLRKQADIEINQKNLERKN